MELTYASLTVGTLIRNITTREVGVVTRIESFKVTVLLCNGQEKGTALLLPRSEVLTWWETFEVQS